MHRPLSFWLRGLCHVLLLALAGYLIYNVTRPRPVEVTLDDQPFRVSGPYTHENLSVYLIHSDQQDELHYITLQEGLEKGLVKVTEKENSQVNELQIDNQSDQHLFLQEGDRLKGGQQDRTIYASHVVPPKSGPQGLPAFCIEPSRWSGAKEFKNASNAALAPQEVRFAAKYLNSQGEVWANVARQREAINTNVQQNRLSSVDLLNYSTTSLNEALDAPQIKKLCDDFATALDGIVKQHPDARGVAIVINGQVEEVNVYPNHGLLAKQYPRLVQSYAVQAASDQGQQVKVLTPLEVARVMLSSQNEENPAAVVAQARAFMVINDEEMVQTGVGLMQNDVNANDFQTQTTSFRNALMLQQAGQQGQVDQLRSSGRILYQRMEPAPQPAARVSRSINSANQMELFQGAGVAGGKTEFNGKTVHWQFIRSGQAASPQPAPNQPRQQNLQRQQQEAVPQLQAQPPAPNAPPQQ